jgi:invasion protein IalB
MAHVIRALMLPRISAHSVRSIVAGAALALIGLASAQAQNRPATPAAPATAPAGPTLVGRFDSWTVAEIGTRADKTCYVTARPERSESRPANVRRGDILLTVTHQASAQRRDEVSFQAGYPFRPGAIVGVEVDNRRFELVTRTDVDDDIAWTKDPAADRALVAAMRAGRVMVIRGVSARGTETVDTFNLTGFARALTAVNTACGVR